MKKFLLNNLWWIPFIIAVVLLVAHVFSFQKVKVDNTTITLLIIILISPFISAIKKIKFGDFEAEITPKEVQKVREDAKLAEITEGDECVLTELKALKSIQDLVKDDSVLALAKIRIEIEKLITKLHASLDLKPHFRRHIPLAKMIVDLNRQEILSPEISHSLREVLAICNRAVHGEEIRKQDAETIVKTGVELLQFLYSEVPMLITGTTKSEENISGEERDEYMTAKYQVTTVVPLHLTNPLK